ncbi:hypothetical protein [Bacillus bombysepticus]|uniref:hypothetical protein n=1 Tax=Bacillus bombysepticus TaxID=658666 RepID=UPI00301A77FC
MKKYIASGITGVVVLTGGILLFNSLGDSSNSSKKTDKPKDSIVVENSNINEWISVDLQKDLYKQGEGTIGSWYKRGEGSYLVITQTGQHSYDQEFTGDKIGWFVRDGSSSDYRKKWLTDGSREVKVVMDNSNPYLKDRNKTWLIIVERDASKKISGSKVYEVEDGQLKKPYNLKGEFHNIQRTKAGELVIVERVYGVEGSLFEVDHRPYSVNHLVFKEGNWVSLDKNTK